MVDSERSVDDLRPSQIDAVLELSDSLGGPLVVPTVPVRRCDADALLEEYLRLLQRRENLGLCVVAGNPAYLSSEDASKRPGRLLWRACRLAADSLGGRLLLLGTESVESVSARICSSLAATPFLLLDLSAGEEVEAFSKASGRPVAVYAPFYIGDGLPEPALGTVVSYASRRKRLLASSGDGRVGPGEALRVSLVGGVEEVLGRVAELAARGAGLLVGFPALLSREQVESFARLGR